MNTQSKVKSLEILNASTNNVITRVEMLLNGRHVVGVMRHDGEVEVYLVDLRGFEIFVGYAYELSDLYNVHPHLSNEIIIQVLYTATRKAMEI